jgi:hypothetical protein
VPRSGSSRSPPASAAARWPARCTTAVPSCTTSSTAGSAGRPSGTGWSSRLALASLYAAERVYFDIWSAIRPQADRSAPYWPLVDAWSNPTYEIWLASLGRLVDATTATPEMLRTFDRVVRLELLFLDALRTGAEW